MPAVQTTYNPRPAIGLEGNAGSTWRSGEVLTKTCETVAGIGFGRAVSEGANAGGAVLGGATRFIGITMRDITLVKTEAQTVDLYQQRQSMGVKVRGDIWVKPVTAVAHGDIATYDAVTGQLNPAAAGVAIPGSRYKTSALAGALALLDLTAEAPGTAP